MEELKVDIAPCVNIIETMIAQWLIVGGRASRGRTNRQD
jgi:hypothetical protein